MDFIRYSPAVGVLLMLCGCSAIQLPRFRTTPDPAPVPKADLPVAPKSAPPLLELVPSGLQPVALEQIERCSELLGLSEELDKPADPTNFGERESRDVWGRPLNAKPQVIVLHETVIGEKATVDLFQTPHPEDADQVSYHMLIARDGSRLRIVPDNNRAYGSGMSAFGDATQRREPGRVGSLNNIALHVSLVSPVDGRDDRGSHSGYSPAQYRNLAGQVLLWQARHGIPLTRLTTHQAVDRSRSRYDPRSFRWDRFMPLYQQAARLCGLERFDNGQAGL
ncbi:N-acetylmuramoyl-L-alanine amidase [Synechococcus sp. UW140]|uniref:N-acetylmuramoyl-L-alanine amidase n=1 Tax=Synechococcus sp. UW140 TaxID=368503 RepID=UPI000E0F1535|nr:peptidoglycan recognition family protein [Synechococcus sp. UW140]